MEASPGRTLGLTAVPARSDKDAAQYYPAMYWWALLNPPAASEFPMAKIEPGRVAKFTDYQQLKPSAITNRVWVKPKTGEHG